MRLVLRVRTHNDSALGFTPVFRCLTVINATYFYFLLVLVTAAVKI